MSTKNYVIKFFLAHRKNGPWGPKMAIFGQKHHVLAKNGDFYGPKIFEKNFVFRFFGVLAVRFLGIF